MTQVITSSFTASLKFLVFISPCCSPGYEYFSIAPTKLSTVELNVSNTWFFSPIS